MANVRLPMLLGHREDRVPIGEWTEIYSDSAGLKGSPIFYNQGIQAARETLFLINHDKISGVSLGYHATKYHENEYGGKNIEEAYPFEASVVLFPANKYAQIERVHTKRDSI